MKRSWGSRSAGARFNSARRRWTPPPDETNGTVIGVLHFGWNGERLNMSNNDPTNFAARVNSAETENAAWHRRNPTRWAGTRSSINIERVQAEEKKLGRHLTYAEKIGV